MPFSPPKSCGFLQLSRCRSCISHLCCRQLPTSTVTDCFPKVAAIITLVPHAPLKYDLAATPLRVGAWSLPWIWASFNGSLVTGGMWQTGHCVAGEAGLPKTAALARLVLLEGSLYRSVLSLSRSLSHSLSQPRRHAAWRSTCVLRSPGPGEPGFSVISSQVSDARFSPWANSNQTSLSPFSTRPYLGLERLQQTLMQFLTTPSLGSPCLLPLKYLPGKAQGCQEFSFCSRQYPKIGSPMSQPPGEGQGGKGGGGGI